MQKLLPFAAEVCSAVCFFFQAEDGIRDYKVTGVQTCALPISCVDSTPVDHGGVSMAPQQQLTELQTTVLRLLWEQGELTVGQIWEQLYTERSEERRVGKECRSRGSPYH